MRTRSRSSLGSLFLLLLCACAARSGAAPSAASPANSTDRLLQRRIAVQANGIPLRYLLKRIETVTGVPLSVTGRVGDERVLVRVKEAPLHEVMSSLAELYRLQWSRSGSGDAEKYVLSKAATATREEDDARERSFRVAYAEWLQRETEARDPAVPERPLTFRLPGRPPIAFDAGIKECQARLLPLARPELPRLLREGVLTQPLAHWPGADREGAIHAVRTWLENQDRATYQLHYAAADERREQNGEVPIRARLVPRPGRAEQSSLRIELEARPQLFLSAAILTPDGQSHALARKRTFIPEGAGVELYAGRALRPIQSGSALPAPLPESDLLARRLVAPASPEAAEVSLVERLDQVSAASGLSIYADDTSGTWLLSNRRPAEGYGSTGGMSAADALDAVCRQDALRDAAHSFWWRRGSTVFLRSRNWLWESQAVLPADLPQSLAAAIRRSERAGAPDLHRLATLSGLQVVSLQSRPGALVAWKYFLQASEALSLASRFRLANGELSWERLPDADRAMLLRLVPAARSEPVAYSVRLESWLQMGDGGHETAVVTLDGHCGREKISTGLRIPVPDLRKGLTVSVR